MNDSGNNQGQEENDTPETFQALVLSCGLDKLNPKSELSEVATAFALFVKKTSSLDPLQNVVKQQELIDFCDEEKISSYKKLIGAAYPTKEELKSKNKKNGVLGKDLDDIEEWGTEVNGEELLEEIKKTLNRFVILPPGADLILALFYLACRFIDNLDLFPILHISSITRSSGKSILLEICCSFLLRGIMTADISYAAVFRLVDSDKAALCIDEIDELFKTKPELQNFINASYTKKTAEAFVRFDAEGSKERKYSAWGPKIVAGIGDIKSDTTKSRAIKIPLKKKKKKEKVERFRSRKIDKITFDTNKKMARFATDNTDKFVEVMDQDPYLPKELDDRTANNFEPLFAVADLISKETGDDIREIALERMGAQVEEESSNTVLLLRDMKQVFEKEGEVVHTATFVAELNKKEDSSWGGWNNGKGINARNIAKLLKDLEIKSKTLLTKEQQLKGYKKEWFEDAFSRHVEEVDGLTDVDGGLTDDPSTPKPLENKDNKGLVDGLTDNPGGPGDGDDWVTF